MIRINLLGVERQKTRRAPAFDIGQRITLACSLILVTTGLLVGWWYWSLGEASARVDAEIVSSTQEVGRLKSIIAEVEQFEQRKQRLQQRKALIDQLRNGQSAPVQLLDYVSRSLPEMLWLTQMEQSGPDVTIEGRSTTLMAVSDFVANLGATSFFTKPIEIVGSQVENNSQQQAGVEVIKFTVKAQLVNGPPRPTSTTRR
jgi:type IV pilus assembly protein PilN